MITVSETWSGASQGWTSQLFWGCWCRWGLWGLIRPRRVIFSSSVGAVPAHLLVALRRLPLSYLFFRRRHLTLSLRFWFSPFLFPLWRCFYLIRFPPLMNLVTGTCCSLIIPCSSFLSLFFFSLHFLSSLPLLRASSVLSAFLHDIDNDYYHDISLLVLAKNTVAP